MQVTECAVLLVSVAIALGLGYAFLGSLGAALVLVGLAAISSGGKDFLIYWIGRLSRKET